MRGPLAVECVLLSREDAPRSGAGTPPFRFVWSGLLGNRPCDPLLDLLIGDEVATLRRFQAAVDHLLHFFG